MPGYCLKSTLQGVEKELSRVAFAFRNLASLHSDATPGMTYHEGIVDVYQLAVRLLTWLIVDLILEYGVSVLE